MLKKLIAYQRLLLNSTPPIETNPQNPSKALLFGFAVFALFFINMFIFSGNTISTNNILPIALPIISVWMINRILNGDYRLFETVPVTRKYTVLNIFLLSIVIILLAYVTWTVISLVLFGVIAGILYLVYPQGFSQSPPETVVYQLISTTKGDILMLCILVIILFAGIAITFIKSKKLRFWSFTGFASIGSGLLILLKFNMPISPNSDKVEFLESFSIMRQGDTILLCVAIAAVIICVASIFMGYKLYVGKSNCAKIN